MLSRREFLRRSMLYALALAGGNVLAACRPEPTATQPPTSTAAQLEAPSATPPPPAVSTSPPAPTPTSPPAPVAATQPADAGGAYLAVARGEGVSPTELTRRAIAAVGGIERFVKRGDDVIVKPNICNAYHGPEYASTTNPEVVAAIVALCLEAGARRVRVMDFPFGGTAQNAYRTSGIAEAVEAVGGQMEVMSDLKYRAIEIPNAQALKKTEVYGDILDTDVLINVPIAKHHSMARLTLGLKNLMGTVKDRGAFHARGLPQSIVDLATVVRPHLTVVDAIRILVANGPTGGDLNDVKQMNTVIASADTVAADAYAATLFGLSGADVAYIRIANERGLGVMDLNAIQIAEIHA
ncbi:MAG: DUF362 domain-containing protein [Anaerolineae bacterium]|nr:DUF362 domain-containing protein [Anaerolineae bacterium]